MCCVALLSCRPYNVRPVSVCVHACACTCACACVHFQVVSGRKCVCTCMRPYDYIPLHVLLCMCVLKHRLCRLCPCSIVC